jgi:hypothetical protein
LKDLAVDATLPVFCESSKLSRPRSTQREQRQSRDVLGNPRSLYQSSIDLQYRRIERYSIPFVEDQLRIDWGNEADRRDPVSRSLSVWKVVVKIERLFHRMQNQSSALRTPLALRRTSISPNKHQILVALANEDATKAGCDDHTASAESFSVPIGRQIATLCDKLHLAGLAVVEDAIAGLDLFSGCVSR